MTIITTKSLLGRSLLAGIAAFAVAGTAQAGPITVTGPGYSSQTMTLRISDLNLASDSGRSSLTNRIALASRRVCGLGYGSALDNTNEAKACVAAARTEAWAQADARLASGSKADLVVGVQ